jgi:predicted dienelactone hydrolase
MFRQHATLVEPLLIMATILVSAATASFGLGGIPLAPASPNIQTANSTGSYKIGIRQQTHVFEGRNLTFYWYYPATPASGSTPYVSTGGVVGQAVLDAPLDKSASPYPLIMFSPGLAAWADAYYFYSQNLASHGYIVVSMEHNDTKKAVPTGNSTLLALANTFQGKDEGDKAVETLYTEWFRSTQLGMTYRPQELKFGLDTVLNETQSSSSLFFDAVDTGNIGLSGHSLGAYYSLVVGGGVPIYCDYNMTAAQLDPDNPILANVSPCAFPTGKALSDPFEFKDIRFKAIIPLAAPFFIDESQLPRSAANISVPMMILTGDDLQLESTRRPQFTTFENATGPSYWVMVANTSHYLVGDNYQLNPTFSKRLSEPDRADFLKKAYVYMVYSAAFFDVYLKNDTSAMATLQKSVSPFVADLQFHSLNNTVANTTATETGSATATSTAPNSASSTGVGNQALPGLGAAVVAAMVAVVAL